jgi:hypothetical protein
LGRIFDVEWKFSAYTAHEFVLTDVGKSILGYAITDQQYTKANLLSVPLADRILVPKASYPTIEAFKNDNYGTDEEDINSRAVVEYNRYNESLCREVPLTLHTASHGGRLAYLGFINNDGNIPHFVRSLCMDVQTSINQ